MIEKTLQDIKGLIRVSTGGSPPDLVIRDIDILDVYGMEVFRGNIWVHKHWIAYVGDKMPATAPETAVIEGKGLTAVPGYIDAHGHADLFYNPATFADYVVTRGATTVYSDAHDMANSLGVKGFAEVLKMNDGFTLKFIWGVPATYPPYPEVEGGAMLAAGDVQDLFSRYRDCASISELSSYVRILNNDDDILERMFIARSYGRNIEGHTLGASYDKLNTLVAAGITSCHESIRAADVRNRVRLGLYTMVRHSSIRSDFAELCPVIREMPRDSIILVSDGVFAHDLCTKGYMDFVIKEAMRFGLDPKDAIRMCTLNPARYFRLDYDVGSITPGRIADIAILEGLENPTPVKVIERGRIAAEKGVLQVPSSTLPDIRNRHNPYAFTDARAEEFAIGRKGDQDVPVIDIVDRTVTKRVNLPLAHADGLLLPDRTGDIRKVCYTRRDRKHWGKGFVRGIGAAIGGIASSIAHETHGFLVLGFDDNDMALAARTLIEMDGGIVLADGGSVIHSLPLPFGATMSLLPMNELAAELTKLNALFRERGSRLDDPLWTMGFLTFTSIVELRITVSGIYDVKKGEIIF